ncbi:MAG TPA: hypothetical protein VES88_03990 [Gemmatimonadaceae bacterium]|nr:hypothetical protein [Gemmatimonadaceae bacterium]
MIQDWVPLLTIVASLLLVVTSALNFSVFLRQLRASKEQLETARRQLEEARQGPEILLVQRAMSETSDHLKTLIDRPYLRPYFYDNKAWAEGDKASLDEVKTMAELMLNNFASAIIHSAAFPQYPVRSVEQTIRFHLRQSPAMREFLMEGFEHYQLAGLALLCLKNESKAETERDLADLIAASPSDVRERARRERLLQYLRSTNETDAIELAKHSLSATGDHPVFSVKNLPAKATH